MLARFERALTAAAVSLPNPGVSTLMSPKRRRRKLKIGHWQAGIMAGAAAFSLATGTVPVGVAASNPSCPVPGGSTGVTDVGCANELQLDGNIPFDSATTPTHDWAPDGSNSGGVMTSSGGVAVQGIDNTGVLADYAQPDTTYFHGSMTDTQNSSSWKCVSANNATNKDDLLNAYAFVVQPTSGPRQGDRILYVGSERQTNNGDAFAGFWLLQNGTTCNSAGSGNFQTTGHTSNDVLLLANYTGGGSISGLSVMRWDPTASNNLRLVANSTDCQDVTFSSDACGRVNGTSQTPPWPDSTGGSAALPTGDFLEVGVDLTALGLDHQGSQTICTSTFLAETRSSQQVTATLKDYATGNFNICANTETHTDNSATANVHVGDMVHDTATITDDHGNALPNATGSVTYNLYAGTACGTTTPVYTDTVTVTGGVVPNSGDFQITAAGTYEWQAVYSGDTANEGIDQGSTSVCGDEPVVATATPTLSTNAAGVAGTAISGTVGTAMSIGDTATLSGFSNLISGDSVSFQLYGPTTTSAPSCTTAVGNAVSAPVDTTSGMASTGAISWTPSASGTYYWLATFSGDANNAAISTPVGCGDSAEAVTVSAAAVLPVSVVQGPKPAKTGDWGMLPAIGVPFVLAGVLMLAIARRRREVDA